MTYIKREEQAFRDALQLDLERHSIYCRILHGNMYQSGLPDLVAITPTSMTFFMELKYWNKQGLPTVSQCLGLLKGPQRNVILNEMWARRSAPCLVVAQNHTDQRLASIVYKERIAHVPWALISSASARAVNFTELLHVLDLSH